jgi:hypothetical protein
MTGHDRRIAKLESSMGIFRPDVLDEMFGAETALRLRGDRGAEERQSLLAAIDAELAIRGVAQ